MAFMLDISPPDWYQFDWYPYKKVVGTSRFGTGRRSVRRPDLTGRSRGR